MFVKMLLQQHRQEASYETSSLTSLMNKPSTQNDKHLTFFSIKNVTKHLTTHFQRQLMHL